jgi:cysteine-rich repeat protein
LQFDVDYDAAPGEFLGSGPDVNSGGTLECFSAVTGGLGAFSDDDAERLLTAGIIKQAGFAGPAAVATCVFVPDDGTEAVPEDFIVTVTDAKDPDVNPVRPLPSVEVSSIDCSECGNGVVDSGEECDDANLLDDDGCSSSCTIETGWDCAGTICTEICGDGLVVGIELCDDSNSTGGDGCSERCAIEAGWDCAEPPATCDELCGDGFVVGAEQCDDGDDQWAQGEACAVDCAWLPCCDPDGSGDVTASDALYVLLKATGLRETCDTCICDSLSGAGGVPVTAVDALVCLRTAVNIPTPLACPDCARSVLALDMLEGIADVHAGDVWDANTARGTPVATSDPAGNTYGYIFPYARDSDSAPTEQQILDAVADSRALYDPSDPRFYDQLKQRIGEIGAVRVAATTSDFPVLETLEGLHPYYLNFDVAEDKAAEILGDASPVFEGVVYVGPHEEYFEFSSGQNELFLHIYTLIRRDEIAPLAGATAPTASSTQAFAPEVAERRDRAWEEMAHRATSPHGPGNPAQTVIKKIPNDHLVPVVDWTCWCVPTAQTMVTAYWDHYANSSTINGYGRVVDYWYEQGCGQNVPNYLHELCDLKNTSACPDGCKWAQNGGVEGILNNINGYNFTWSQVEGTSSNDWAWKSLTDEIDAGRPAVWSVGPQSAHAMTALGYRTSGSQKFVIVYNTWGTTAAQQLREYNYDQWAGAPIKDSGVGRLTAGGSEAPDHAVLTFPRGEEVLFGSQQISWQVWGPSIIFTTLSFSSDGGKNWSNIASNVSTNQGTNNYQWNASTTTNKGRIRIQTYDLSGKYVAGDGSVKNFFIQSKPDLIPTAPPNSQFCQRNAQGQLVVSVKNQGTTNAVASMTRVAFNPGGTVLVATPAITAGQTATVAVDIPGACWNMDCDFTITVDANGAVNEANEGNNSANGLCLG